MKKIGKIILIILLVGLVVAGISALVKASPNTQPSPATYSIQITQHNCLVRVLNAENTPVDKLIQGEEYSVTVIFGEVDVPYVKYVDINDVRFGEDELPYTFTATEDIAIVAWSAQIQPSPPELVGGTYAKVDTLAQFVNINFYDTENNSVDMDKLVVGQTYTLQITPFEGYVVNGWWVEFVNSGTYEENPVSFVATNQMFITVNAGIASGESE